MRCREAAKPRSSWWRTMRGAVAGAGVALLAGPALAEPTVLFILDGSGSMWGRIEGDTPKIEAAREVMGGLLRELPDDLAVGLMAYGHTRKGDCADIQMIAAPRAGSGAALVDALERITPRGKTPIADTLVRAGQQLEQIEDEASVVLVSDGIETCGGDPCAVAEALHERDIRLKFHVVGYDVDDEARAQLQCVAEKGGGDYFQADDVAGLNEALTSVAEKVVAASPPPPPKVEAPAATSTTTTVKVQVAGPATVELTPADWVKLPPYYWKLVDPETGEEITRTRENSVVVQPGTYGAVWRQIQHGASEVALPAVVTAEAGKTSGLPVDTGLRLTPPEGTEAPYYWQLVDDAGESVARYRLLHPVPVPSGRFRLIWRQTEHGHTDTDVGEVDIAPGKLNDVVLDQGIMLALADWIGEARLRVDSGAPLAEGIEYLKIVDEQGREMFVERPGPIFLAPGRYQLGLRLTEHMHDEVPWGEIEVPEAGFVDPKLASGLTFVTDREADHTLFAVDLDSGAEFRMHDRWGPFALPPGRYQIDLQPDHGDRLTILPEVEIGESQHVQVQM